MINQIQTFINKFLNLMFSVYSILILFMILTFYHILLHFIRDRRYLQNLEGYEDSGIVSIKNLREIPLINIVIPAWNEGEEFKQCLSSIDMLTYPKLKVVINVGGSKETINIANGFKKNSNFQIIYQKRGEGKLKAINDCLSSISKGIVCIIDADLLLTDKILLKMIYPIISKNENIVIAPIVPHSSILNKSIVKYAYINRNAKFKFEFKRYMFGFSSNSCILYKVIEVIGKFSEKKMLDDGQTIALDLSSKGFKTYQLIEPKIQAYTYPIKINEYSRQNIRWIENKLFLSIRSKKYQFIKFIVLVFISFYLFIFPFFLFFNIFLFIVGLFIIYSMYLKKIRKIVFFSILDKNNFLRFKFNFYLKLLFYIYLDAIIDIIVLFEILFYRKAYKRRKNLLS